MTDDIKPFPKKRRPPPLPIPCAQCASQMTVQAEGKLPGTTFVGWCSHNNTIVHAHIGLHGDIRAWQLLGPFTPEQARDVLTDSLGPENAVKAFRPDGELTN